MIQLGGYIMPIFFFADKQKEQRKKLIKNLVKKALERQKYNPDTDPVLLDFKRKMDEIDRRYKK